MPTGHAASASPVPRASPPGGATPDPAPPAVIQGGMGVGVSGWRLARAVSLAGQLGVVSGVALDAQLARRLQLGDTGGHLRRALAVFPDREAASRILARYFVPGGIPPGRPFRPVPRPGLRPDRHRDELTAAGNFAEVWLAKEGHGGPVGVNYMEKIQLATQPAVYGAMLAGVDHVLVGAGIPGEIPGVLDALSTHSATELTVAVEGSDARHTAAFDPGGLAGAGAPPLIRPRLLAIVSSAVLAVYLHRSPATRPDGFVLESHTAGGHSAPPRGRRAPGGGEPVYGPRDRIDPAKVAALGLPFWLAGGRAGRRSVADARALGAAGVQAGTAFALARESGLEPGLRRRLLAEGAAGSLPVRNDPLASPTGFPFKVARLSGTLSEDGEYERRPRLCDLGYLRTPYLKENGAVGYRCPAEPVDLYTRKGGAAGDAAGRRCLCNALTANVGLHQHRADGYVEPPLLTAGQDLGFLADLVREAGTDYSAADVVRYLLAE
ncbi:Nitronate monooxygenase [Nocardiopsis flavescens]|uniref:Nitronate monooxygenase n=1 Tax=Nocardiopsis flavescens TaxID=758803 RepID=A0A1M6CN57_9ACTN|nr:nitronate monooxygenase [Nocardiopsis flavescens]SHI62224.1 Nitronate monooxygenase [Nocardiopsis flavescens]